MKNNIDSSNVYFQVWLSNNNGEILIHDFNQIRKGSSDLRIRDITISDDNILTISSLIEDKWGVLCQINNLDKMYSYSYKSGKTAIGYSLFLHLNDEESGLILERSKGNFINYKILEETISLVQLPEQLKDAMERIILYTKKRIESSDKLHLKEKVILNKKHLSQSL